MPPRVAPLVVAWLIGLPFVAGADMGLGDSMAFLPFHAWLLGGAALACLQAVLARMPPAITWFDVSLLLLAGWFAGRGLFTHDRHAGLAAGLAMAALFTTPLGLGWFRESPEGRVWLWRLLFTQGLAAAAEWGVARGVGVVSAGGLAPAVLLGSVAVALGWRPGWPLGIVGVALVFALSPRAGTLPGEVAPSDSPWGLGPGQGSDFLTNNGLPPDLPAPVWFHGFLAGGWVAVALALMAVMAWLVCARKAIPSAATPADGPVSPPVWLAWGVQAGLVLALFARLATADPDHRIAELAFGAARSLAAALALALGRVGCPGPETGKCVLLAFGGALGAALALFPSMAHPGALAMMLAALSAFPLGGMVGGVSGRLAGVAVLALVASGLVLGGLGVTGPAALAWRESAQGLRLAENPANLDGKTLDARRPLILDPFRRAARLDPDQALWRLQLAGRADTLFALGRDWQRSAWLDEVRKEGLRHAMEAQRLRPRNPGGFLAEVKLRMATGRWLVSRGFTEQAMGQFDAAARKAEVLAGLDPGQQSGSGLYLAFQARLEGFESLGAGVADLRKLLAEQKRVKAAAALALLSCRALTPSQRAELEAWGTASENP